MKPANTQQRAFYRMDTMLTFSYRVLSEEEAQYPLPSAMDSGFIEQYFPSAIVDIEERIDTTLELIRSKSALMADALSALNDKLNFIMQAMGEDAIKHTLPSLPVNISAGGLSFETNQSIDDKSMVDLLLILDSHAQPMLVRSQVVKVVANPDATYMVAVEFKDLTSNMRRQLVQFIQTKEIELAKHKVD